MAVADPWSRAESRLEGEPDAFLTALLVLVALVALVVAWRGPRLLKVGVLAWMLLP